MLTLGLGGFRKTPSESTYPWNQNTWQTVPQKWLSRWIRQITSYYYWERYHLRTYRNVCFFWKQYHVHLRPAIWQSGVDSRNASFNDMHRSIVTCCLFILFTWCSQFVAALCVGITQSPGSLTAGSLTAWLSWSFTILAPFLGVKYPVSLRYFIFLISYLRYITAILNVLLGNFCIVHIYESILSMWLKIWQFQDFGFECFLFPQKWPLAHLVDDKGPAPCDKRSVFGSDISDGLTMTKVDSNIFKPTKYPLLLIFLKSQNPRISNKASRKRNLSTVWLMTYELGSGCLWFSFVSLSRCAACFGFCKKSPSPEDDMKSCI